MTFTIEKLVEYRLHRAWETFEDAEILAERGKWNSTINRLYYAAYYAVSALLLDHGLKSSTHTGVKSNFTKHFIKTSKLPKELGKIYSQLFTWRHKGDYDDLFDFDKMKTEPYFQPVKSLIENIEMKIIHKRNSSAK